VQNENNSRRLPYLMSVIEEVVKKVINDKWLQVLNNQREFFWGGNYENLLAPLLLFPYPNRDKESYI
jgi:hypothetical protein